MERTSHGQRSSTSWIHASTDAGAGSRSSGTAEGPAGSAGATPSPGSVPASPEARESIAAGTTAAGVPPPSRGGRWPGAGRAGHCRRQRCPPPRWRRPRASARRRRELRPRVQKREHAALDADVADREPGRHPRGVEQGDQQPVLHVAVPGTDLQGARDESLAASDRLGMARGHLRGSVVADETLHLPHESVDAVVHADSPPARGRAGRAGAGGRGGPRGHPGAGIRGQHRAVSQPAGAGWRGGHGGMPLAGNEHRQGRVVEAHAALDQPPAGRHRDARRAPSTTIGSSTWRHSRSHEAPR